MSKSRTVHITAPNIETIRTILDGSKLKEVEQCIKANKNEEALSIINHVLAALDDLVYDDH